MLIKIIEEIMTTEQQLIIEGITVDLILELHRKYQMPVLSSIRRVYTSDTYKLVSDPDTGFLHYSHLYIFETLEKEIFYGTP